MAAAFNPMMTQFYAMQQMEAAKEKQELRAQINELKNQGMVKGPGGPYGGGGAGQFQVQGSESRPPCSYCLKPGHNYRVCFSRINDEKRAAGGQAGAVNGAGGNGQKMQLYTREQLEEQLQREKEEAERKTETDELKRMLLEMKQQMETPGAAVASSVSPKAGKDAAEGETPKAMKKLQKKMAAELQQSVAEAVTEAVQDKHAESVAAAVTACKKSLKADMTERSSKRDLRLRRMRLNLG